MKHAHLGIIIDKTVFLNWQHRILKHTNHPTTTRLPWSQIIPPYSANSRAFQLWKQPTTNYLPEGGTHICLICQHIITEPITNSELTARWQRGQSAVCVWAERMSVYPQHGSALCRSALPLRPPWETEATAGNLKPHDVILREHGLPAVSEKVYKTQSQHHTITGVNCIYSWAAVVDYGGSPIKYGACGRRSRFGRGKLNWQGF